MSSGFNVLQDARFYVRQGQTKITSSLFVMLMVIIVGSVLLFFTARNWPLDYLNASLFACCLGMLVPGFLSMRSRFKEGAELIEVGVWRLRQAGYQVRVQFGIVWLRNPIAPQSPWVRV